MKWLGLLAVLAVLDLTTAIVAPSDAWNPLHPHPAPWHAPAPLSHIPLRTVCPNWPGHGCYSVVPGRGQG